MLLQKLHNIWLALRALKKTWQEEQSFRIQVGVALLVLSVAWYCRVTRIEWALLLFSLSAVLTVELINTAIERIADAFGRTDQRIGLIKDLGAAAAGIIGLGTIAVLCAIFVPRFFSM